MSNAIDSAMLTAMRTAIADLLPDTCNILTVTRTPDGMGGNTEAWGTTYSGVSCRVDLAQSGIDEMVQGAELKPYPQYVLSVPYDTVLTSENRIEHNSVTYAVTKVNTSQSWKAVARAVLELV